MNKFVIIGIVLVGIVVGGIVWKEYGASDANKAIETGVVKEFTVVSKKLEWTFDPESITVEQGDRVKVKVINEDDFDHGFAKITCKRNH
jgi:plastocyanin